MSSSGHWNELPKSYIEDDVPLDGIRLLLNKCFSVQNICKMIDLTYVKSIQLYSDASFLLIIVPSEWSDKNVPQKSKIPQGHSNHVLAKMQKSAQMH